MKTPPADATCGGCGISLHDGYCLHCEICSDRRSQRLGRGMIFSPTCYAGEMIDNRDPRGRLVARVWDAA